MNPSQGLHGRLLGLARSGNRLTINPEAAMEIRWNPKTLAHMRKHQAENPEITPEFVERFLREAHPTKIYSDKTYPHRHILEGYFPPDIGRPYRIVFELDDDAKVWGKGGGIWPIAAFRIRDTEFRKSR